MIYENVFRDQVLELEDTGFTLLEEDHDSIKTTAHVKQYLSLLRVSRQLYRETALLPYQLTTFNFGCARYPGIKPLDVLEMFLLNRSWAQISRLRNLKYFESQWPYHMPYVEKTGTGLYWFAHLGLKPSELDVHGTVAWHR
jgi:hypothetical protein